MTYQSYDLSRYFDGDPAESTLITVAGVDTVNCAHLLAAGFNTMSRNMMNGSVLAVVDTRAGTVEYDGKIEKIDRPEPANPLEFKQTFKFEPSADSDTMIQFTDDNGNTTFTGFGSIKIDGAMKYAHIARSVLESAYAELQAVKEVLADAGVETIPADVGVKDLLAVKRAMSEQIAKLTHEREQANAAARAEMIEYVKGAYAKLGRLDAAGERDDLQGRMRGMLDVLSEFLVVTGEADASEGHAVARRLCGISDE